MRKTSLIKHPHLMDRSAWICSSVQIFASTSLVRRRTSAEELGAACESTCEFDVPSNAGNRMHRQIDLAIHAIGSHRKAHCVAAVHGFDGRGIGCAISGASGLLHRVPAFAGLHEVSLVFCVCSVVIFLYFLFFYLSNGLRWQCTGIGGAHMATTCSSYGPRLWVALRCSTRRFTRCAHVARA